MRNPRGLTPEEAAAWRRVTATVTPLRGKVPPPPEKEVPTASEADGGESRPAATPVRPRPVQPPGVRGADPTRSRPLTRHGLDASWERRLANAQVAPDLAIDLHGLNLDQAHGRLVLGLEQALAMGARVVLLIAGKPRPNDDHGFPDFGGRGTRRGAIRAKLLDWLAASPHAGRIAAVRSAHPRHGGDGAVYVVLRRPQR